MESIGIEVLQAFEDNYIYLLHSKGSAVVVDPGQSEQVLKYLKQNQLNLSAIFITHHHSDHVGGVSELLSHFPNADVICFEKDSRRIPCASLKLEAFPEKFSKLQKQFLGLDWYILHIPGHTLGHVAYLTHFNTHLRSNFFHHNNLPSAHVFVGDTVFGAGSGYLFEGSYKQMNSSVNLLVENIQAFQEDACLWCAHEYTLKNLNVFLNFQVSEIFKNSIAERIFEIEKRPNVKTVPLILSEELKTNLFLNSNNNSLKEIHGVDSSVEMFKKIRKFRDNY
jgi:hydroxyacylglutathione hydrolase